MGFQPNKIWLTHLVGGGVRTSNERIPEEKIMDANYSKNPFHLAMAYGWYSGLKACMPPKYRPKF